MDISHLTQKDIERIWSRIDKSGDCWLWNGSLDTHGYPKTSVKRNGIAKTFLIHRVIYRLEHGPIEPGLCICHSCDTPRCVNPAHLWKGTHMENSRDKIAKGRHARGETSGARLHPERTPRGSAHCCAKLTEQQVLDIRAKYVPKVYTIQRLAREYNVSDSLIGQIIHRVWWKHI